MTLCNCPGQRHNAGCSVGGALERVEAEIVRCGHECKWPAVDCRFADHERQQAAEITTLMFDVVDREEALVIVRAEVARLRAALIEIRDCARSPAVPRCQWCGAWVDEMHSPDCPAELAAVALATP